MCQLALVLNQLGANGLKDKRHQHPGTQPLLSLLEQAQMKQTLQTPNALWRMIEQS